jgi:hypothetical protein
MAFDRRESHTGRRPRDGAADQNDGDGDRIDAPHDELGFSLRQAALRAVERSRHGLLGPADTLFAMHALYYADRSAKHVQVILASQLRVEYQPPAKLLSSTAVAKADVQDLLSLLSELSSAAVSTAGASVAKAQSDAAESFWAKCQRFVEALEAARDGEEAATSNGSASAVATVMGNSAGAKAAREEIEDQMLDMLSRSENLLEAVAELKALARSPDPAVDGQFYLAAALMGDVLAARRLLEHYDDLFLLSTPVPPPPQALGQAPEGIVTEADCSALMDAMGETLDGDQQLFMDELATYGKEHMPPWAQKPGANPRKPDRFAKVFAGYRWSRYNRAHYNMATNPPPKTVMGYEFTLFYPELQDSRTPRYEVLPTEHGWEDEYCLLVFRAGAPYLDVAYRIVNKQWETKRGGVRAIFEPSGRFKLYFRFTSTSYRR